MNINEILKDNLLLESGIKIPKGAKAAKIIFHEDLDGFFSALLTYHQLVKQGINPKYINFGMAQYGKFGDSYLNQFNVRPGQMIAVVDFADIPEEGQPDFWSDHHVAKKEQVDLFTKKKPSGAIGKKEFGSDTMHIATSHAQGLGDSTTIQAINSIDSAKYKDLADTFDMPTDFKKKNRMQRLAIITNSLISQLIKQNPKMTYQLIKKSQPSLVNVYNNLLGMIKLNNEQSKAIQSINSKNPDWKMIDAVRAKLSGESAVDIVKKGKTTTDILGKEKYASEFVQQVENELKKAKPNWSRIVKIANEMPKRIKTNLRNLLKNIKPKLVEIGQKITNAYEYGKAIEPYKRQIRNLLLDKEEYKGTTGKKIMDIDFWREKTMKDLEMITSAGTKEKAVAQGLKKKFEQDLEEFKAKFGSRKKKSESEDITKTRNDIKEWINKVEKVIGKLIPFVTTKGEIATVDQSTGKHPSRFTSSMVLDPKTKQRLAFTIRKFGMMVQTSANPSLADLDKKDIDLVADMTTAFDYAKAIIEKKYGRGWGFQMAKDKMGGHKAIANLANLHFISMSYEPKQDREKRKELELLKKRATAAGKGRSFGGKKFMTKTGEALKTQQVIQDKSKEIKNEFVNFLIKKLEEIINTKYKGKKVPPARIQPQIREEIEKLSGAKKEPSIEDLYNELLNS